MQRRATERCSIFVWLLTAALVVGVLPDARAPTAASGPEESGAASQPPPDAKPTFEIYGFAMLDIGQNFTQINPNWYDTLRLTRLPSVKDEFGRDNSTFAGVRQSRLGVKSSTPTAL